VDSFDRVHPWNVLHLPSPVPTIPEASDFQIGADSREVVVSIDDNLVFITTKLRSDGPGCPGIDHTHPWEFMRRKAESVAVVFGHGLTPKMAYIEFVGGMT
jgi:hypothetical protein